MSIARLMQMARAGSVKNLVYLGGVVTLGSQTSATLNFSQGFSSADLIIFLVTVEYQGGATPQDNTLSISGASALTKVVAPNTSYVSSSSIYTTSGSNLGSGTSFTVNMAAGTAALARFSVDAYKIKGGASLVDSATSSAQNGSGESVTVDFSSGYLLGVYYTGQDVQHSWSGVTNFYEIPHIQSTFAEGSYAYNDTPTTSSHTVSTSHTAQTNNQGLQLCVVVYDNAGGGDVWTDPDLANASYDSVSFAFGTQDGSVIGFYFKPDGSKMWLVGRNTDAVYQYSLSTPWDISSAAYDSVSLSISAQETDPVDIHFNGDGTKMYIVGYVSDRVHQYTLSTAWDLSSASYDSVSFHVLSQSSLPLGLWFKPDGTKMYINDISNDSVFQYSLSTAWDVSSASYESKSFSYSTQDSSPYKSIFSPNGDKIFMVGTNNDAVFQYSLSTPWDVTTASYDSVSFSGTAQDTSLYSAFFKPDGSKMYLIGNTNDTIYQYST